MAGKFASGGVTEQSPRLAVAALAAHRQGRRQRPAQQPRPWLRQPVCPAVHSVAVKQFVAAIASQHHAHMLAGQRRDEHGWQARRIGVRLVVDVQHRFNEVFGLGLRHNEFVVVGVEVAGNGTGKRCLVLFGFRKADGKRVERLRKLPRRQCRNQTRINAAAQECTDGHVANQLITNRFGQQAFQFGCRRLLVGKRPFGDFIRQRPVAFLFQTGCRNLEPVAGRQFVDMLENSMRRGHETPVQEFGYGRFVAFFRNRQLQQRFQFRGKREGCAVPKIKQRLYSQPVAAKPKGAFRFLVHGKGKHPVQRVHAAHLVLGKSLQDYFRIGSGARRDIVRGGDFTEVVNLAIENNNVLAVSTVHRLVGTCRQVQNAQPAMTEAYRAIEKKPFRIRPPVAYGISHGAQVGCGKPLVKR